MEGTKLTKQQRKISRRKAIRRCERQAEYFKRKLPELSTELELLTKEKEQKKQAQLLALYHHKEPTEITTTNRRQYARPSASPSTASSLIARYELEPSSQVRMEVEPEDRENIRRAFLDRNPSARRRRLSDGSDTLELDIPVEWEEI